MAVLQGVPRKSVSVVKNTKFVPWFYKLVQATLGVLYSVFFGVKAYGVDSIPNDGRGVIFAPNHGSHLDPPLLGVTAKRPITYLAKEYLFKKPVLGRCIEWLGSIPIKSETQDYRSIRMLIRLLDEGHQILVFPEGTRTNDGNIQNVEGGVGFLALKAKCHVVPVYISGSFEALPRGAKWFRLHPIRIYYGPAFIPAEDAEIKTSADPYMATAQSILKRIVSLKNSSGG